MKKGHALDPIVHKTREQASTEKLLLSMTAKLYEEIRYSNNIIRNQRGEPIVGGQMTNTASNFYDRGQFSDYAKPQSRPGHSSIGRRQYIQTRGEPKENQLIQNASEDSMVEKMILNLESRLKVEEEKNKALAEKLEKMEEERIQESTNISKNVEKNREQQEKASKILQKSLKSQVASNMQHQGQQKKNNYGILTQILPYSDRRQIKVKFKIPDLVNLSDDSKMNELISETTEWLGVVYRATASISWNMLSNAQLSFEEIKVLFTENIIFNFIQFLKEMKKTLNKKSYSEITAIVNKKSVSVLEYLCRQYPQTKLEAPNLALRSALPQIENEGRIKFDLVYQSGIHFIFREDGDYTDLIMRMINFMIEKTSDESEEFSKFMRGVFTQVYKPHFKRKKNQGEEDTTEPTHEDRAYKEKVKGYTSFLIGRKIPKNTLLYTEEEIADGVFFVKSHAVLRIVTKWVEDLQKYFDKPDKTILNNNIENKDHYGHSLYISALLKNGIHKKILEQKEQLFQKLEKIKRQCQEMEYLLTAEEYTSDPSQVHLSDEQIRVGMYSVNIKRVISSYICAQLNKLIHFLLRVPKEVPEDQLGNESEVFQSRARKDLNSLNLIKFNLFDLLRCKIHSNEEEIIWIIKYLIHINKTNRDKFKIVRVKDRLQQGTRDIMINGQVNRGLVCQIQLSVTNSSDKKQELLDSYNHFLYELKRAELGAITQNVSIWSNYEQRYAYFEGLMTKKHRHDGKIREVPLKHRCGAKNFQPFKRPIICIQCKKFYPIPQTCLLNVRCALCQVNICGQCFYYNYLDTEERKEYIFEGNRLFKPEIMEKLIEYNDYTKPLPTPGFFIKKDFLTKELSFYMAIEKNKQQNVKDAPNIEILITQTVIKDGKVFNRQVNKKKIQAQLKEGEFYIKKYQKTELNNFLIFYFDKKNTTKAMMKLADLKSQLEQPENAKAKVLNILKEPAYIHKLRLLKKENEKIKQMSQVEDSIEDKKLIVYKFHKFYLLAQVLVKGSLLRADIRKKINLGQLKSFAERQTDIVSMEYTYMTDELEQIQFKFKPKLYKMFCQNLKKLYLSNGTIASIKCFQNFKRLETVFISQNQLTSLEGLQNLQDLKTFIFDDNQVQSLLPFKKLSELKYISGNSNKLKSLSGLEDLKHLRNLSVYENEVESLEEIKNSTELQSLIVRKNPIADLSVIQTIKKARKLYIGSTKVEYLPDLSMLLNLKVLSIDGLNLTKIPNIFSKLHLHEISLSNNKLNEISNLENQTELVYLSLSKNQIQTMEGFDTLDKLETLKLDENKITVVKGLKNLDSLKMLNLKQNPLNDLGDLVKYEVSFKYVYTQTLLTEYALKQLAQLQNLRNTVSSGDD